MESTVVQEVSQQTGYSRLVSWEVYNFMAYTHAKAEFDEKGIVTIKGYNDSGKSAMLQALNVLMFNIKANQQIGFIKDDCDYFRVVAYFDDGVTILRDKYINGQSLYEMYKDDQVIFSTKQGKALTRVSGVPEPIEQYLGLISHDGTCLNSRSCIEKQLLVQTTGSENYKLLNVILKSEELAIATQMLNDDKNRVLQDINSTESRLQSAKELAGVGTALTEDLIVHLERMDKNCDDFDSMLSVLVTIDNLSKNISSIVITPELSAVDCGQIDSLLSIKSLINNLSSIPNLPELPVIDTSDLDLLYSVQSILAELSTIPEIPSLGSIETDQFDTLTKIVEIYESLSSLNTEEDEIKNRLLQLDEEMKKCASQLEEYGKVVIRCPNCGTVYDEESGHSHEKVGA